MDLLSCAAVCEDTCIDTSNPHSKRVELEVALTIEGPPAPTKWLRLQRNRLRSAQMARELYVSILLHRGQQLGMLTRVLLMNVVADCCWMSCRASWMSISH